MNFCSKNFFKKISSSALKLTDKFTSVWYSKYNKKGDDRLVEHIFYSAPNLVSLCIDTGESADMTGRIYHCYAKDAIPFSNATDLLLKLERFYDWLGVPQAERQTRQFGHMHGNEGGRRMTKVKSSEEMVTPKGDLATFVVHVQYRQNATWQGKVIWTDTKQESSFRSALELIKLMDTAIEASAEEKDQPKQTANG